MPRIEFEGVIHDFPDDFTDDEIAAVLGANPPGIGAKVGGFVGGAPPNTPRINQFFSARPGVGVPISDEQWYEESYGKPAANADQAFEARSTYDAPGVRAFHQNRVDEGENRRAMEIGLQSAGRGLADLAGTPVDLSTAAGNLGLSLLDMLPNVDLPGRMENPVGGSDWMADQASQIAEHAGIRTYDPEDMTRRERLLGNIGRFGTSALSIGSGLASAAGQTARGAQGLIGRIIEPLARPYTKGASTLIGDSFAGAGMGAADWAYDEVEPEWLKNSGFSPVVRTLVDIFGGLSGGTAGAVTQVGGRAAADATRRVFGGGTARDLPPDQRTGEYFSKRDVNTAALLMQAQASNPRAATQNIGDTVDQLSVHASQDSMPTTGLASNDVGLIMAENAARVQNARPFIERDQKVQTRAVEQVDKIAPQGADGRDFTDTVEGIYSGRVDAANTDLAIAKTFQQIQQEQDAQAGANLRAMGGPDMRSDAARRVDEAVVDQTLRPMTEQSSRMYESADPNRTAPVDPTSLVEAAAKVRQNLGTLSAPEDVIPQGLLARIERADPARKLDENGVPLEEPPDVPDVTIGDLVQVKPRINTAIDRARRAQNFTLADSLMSMRTAIDNLIADEADAGNPAAARALAADENYANTTGRVFGGAPGDPARQFRRDFNMDRTGRTETPPSQTASTFLQRGQPEKADALMRIVDASPDPAEGQRAAREYLLADMAESNIVDAQTGIIRADSLRNWRNRWGETLNSVPGMRNQVDSMLRSAEQGATLRGQLAADVNAAQARLSQVERDKGALGLVLGRDPTHAVASIFASGDPERNVARLLSEIGANQSAKDGLKASIREWMQNRATTSAVHNTTDGSNPISFARLDSLFKEHENTLARVFDPEEMRALRAAHAFLRPLVNRGIQATTGSATAERSFDQFARFLEIGLKARYGILKGGGIMRTLRLWAETLPASDAGVQQLISQMWFDPDLAEHILTRNVKEVNTPIWNKRLMLLLGGIAGARDSVNSDEEDPMASIPTGM